MPAATSAAPLDKRREGKRARTREIGRHASDKERERQRPRATKSASDKERERQRARATKSTNDTENEQERHRKAKRPSGKSNNVPCMPRLRERAAKRPSDEEHERQRARATKRARARKSTSDRGRERERDRARETPSSQETEWHDKATTCQMCRKTRIRRPRTGNAAKRASCLPRTPAFPHA